MRASACPPQHNTKPIYTLVKARRARAAAADRAVFPNSQRCAQNCKLHCCKQFCGQVILPGSYYLQVSAFSRESCPCMQVHQPGL